MNYATDLRDELAAALEDALAKINLPVPVYVEAPDALVPRCYVVTWDGASPTDQYGVWETALGVEVWPKTDLTSAGWREDRDLLLTPVFDLLAFGWSPTSGTVSRWEASNADRQLGQQPYRITLFSVTCLYVTPC